MNAGDRIDGLVDVQRHGVGQRSGRLEMQCACHVAESEIEIDQAHSPAATRIEGDRQVRRHGRLAAPALGREDGDDLACGMSRDRRPNAPARKCERGVVICRHDLANSVVDRPFPQLGVRRLAQQDDAGGEIGQT